MCDDSGNALRTFSGLHLCSLVSLPPIAARAFDESFCVSRVDAASLEDIKRLQPDALLCSIAGLRFDSATVAALPASVKAIATYSVGHDHIDIAACKSRGIAVFNTPGVLGDAVADTALLLILAAARRLTEGIALLREHRWTGWRPDQLPGTGLSGKTLGIYGMGDIGRRIARRAASFGMSIAYCNRNRSDEVRDAAYFPDPIDLLRQSDVFVLACPSTPKTRRFIRTETLAVAKPTLLLVNIGRGDLVRDEDLIDALRHARIGGAALDVFDDEPNIAPGYFELSNVFMTPHVGSSTVEARVAMSQILVDALKQWWRGLRPANQLA